MKNIAGISLSIGIAVIASFIGAKFPVVGGAVIAIFIGILIRNTIGLSGIFSPGVSFTLKTLLKVAIVLLGFGFSFQALASTKGITIAIVLLSFAIGFGLTFLLTKIAKLQGATPLLISAGTAICGGTAIASTGPVLRARQDEVAYAMNTIFLFNVLAVLFYPILGQLIGLSGEQFGVWAGAAIHDTSSVVAAGYSFSDEAGEASVVAKLARTLMLVPVVFLFALWTSISHAQKEPEIPVVKSAIKAFPVFILFFIGAVTIQSTAPLPQLFVDVSDTIAKFLIVMVMVSVGLGTDLRQMKQAGPTALLIGFISSIVMGGVSLWLILLFL
ncbi:putative sulfate exporter family transporter [Paenalkalicoccus suaedae]|uniref:Putative sulfate exporter family transporter n=1 Tax=Paenalkalicoccus suaedae TaxID=2592382 RepID=A0A859FB81_9BACI|nr:putative sulfate exporter family transporter [Paenalkalicoccus suaedae]QKS70052.1 putative sulfate exporter family transporter [Paenalkalicoccus suaedae]